MIAEQKRLGSETAPASVLPLASEHPNPPTRDVESWPRHSSPPSGAVSTPLALAISPGCPRALRITVAQDTLRVLFTVPAGRTHRLGARELKREAAPGLQICPQEQKPGLPPGETTPCPW